MRIPFAIARISWMTSLRCLLAFGFAIPALLCNNFVANAAEPSPVLARVDLSEVKVQDLSGWVSAADRWSKQRVVLFFMSTSCPVANGYVPLMNRFQNRFAKNDVKVVGIQADPIVTMEEASQHIKEYNIEFPVFLNPDGMLAAMCGAQTMGQVVVLDHGKIVYRGRIDDKYELNGKRKQIPQSTELEDAVKAMLAAASPSVVETKAFGCPIPKAKVSVAQKSDSP